MAEQTVVYAGVPILLKDAEGLDDVALVELACVTYEEATGLKLASHPVGSLVNQAAALRAQMKV